MLARAAVELYKADEEQYRVKAINYARRLIDRQVPEDAGEEALYGHFYHYDDFSPLGWCDIYRKSQHPLRRMEYARWISTHGLHRRTL